MLTGIRCLCADVHKRRTRVAHVLMTLSPHDDNEYPDDKSYAIIARKISVLIEAEGRRPGARSSAIRHQCLVYDTAQTVMPLPL